MDLQISSLGIPNDLAGWQVLQSQPPTSFQAFMQDPVLKQQIAYFKANAPKATTAQALLSDPTLQEVALTAFGLTSQIGMTSLMTKVLNSDPSSSTSFAAQMVSPGYQAIAQAFNYGGTVTTPQQAVASSASVALDGVGTNGTFSSFSGSFGGITLNNVDLSAATSVQQVAATLQAAFQRNDGGRSDITVTTLGDELKFNDAKGRGTASGFVFNSAASGVDAETPEDLTPGEQAAPPAGAAAVPSTAAVTLDGLGGGGSFDSFTGTFGGVALSDVDLSGDTTPQQVAATLQSAFQANDGGRSDITVTTLGDQLVFSDAQGRGTAQGFNFASSTSSISAEAATDLVQGQQAASTSTTPAASTANVTISGVATGSTFSSFSGTFGGIALSDVDLSGATTSTQVAATLQQAFQAADGGSSNITVTALGDKLEFADAAGRGTASDFSFQSTSSTVTAGAPSGLFAGVPPAGAATVPSSAIVSVSGVTAATPFEGFSGTFAGYTLSNLDLSSDTSTAQVAATLQQAFQELDGGSTNITVTALGDELKFSDAKGRGTAADFEFDTTVSGAEAGSPTNLVAGSAAPITTPAVASSATVSLGNMTGYNAFTSFSGAFGGVTVQNVDLAGDSSAQAVATDLQDAFDNADGDNSDISVGATYSVTNGWQLNFSDDRGRGTASGFTFTSSTGGPTASAPTNLVYGQQSAPGAVTGQNGPAVTNPSFINTIIQQYTEARFQQVVGNTSNSLREALYAQQELPTVTNWYSVIGNPPLADVIQTVLGLSSSFGALNVDQQAQMLASKMNIKDFQNPTKLNNLLTQYVALAQANGADGPTTDSSGQTTGTPTNPAVTLLSAITGSTGVGVGSSSTTFNTLSASNIAMMVLGGS